MYQGMKSFLDAAFQWTWMILSIYNHDQNFSFHNELVFDKITWASWVDAKVYTDIKVLVT